MIPESLTEFIATGAPYQLSMRGEGFDNIWSRRIEIEGIVVCEIIGGIDKTLPNVTTAVIDLIVQSGALTPKGDEVGTERFILYQQDWRTVDEATKDIQKKESKILWK